MNEVPNSIKSFKYEEDIKHIIIIVTERKGEAIWIRGSGELEDGQILKSGCKEGG